jgi:hypothetical protein
MIIWKPELDKVKTDGGIYPKLVEIFTENMINGRRIIYE